MPLDIIENTTKAITNVVGIFGGNADILKLTAVCGDFVHANPQLETITVNSILDAIQCTAEEHEDNRRIEFVVIRQEMHEQNLQEMMRRHSENLDIIIE